MNNSKYTPPFRVGRKQNRAVLDSNGLEVVIFPEGNERFAQSFCNHLNKVNAIEDSNNSTAYYWKLHCKNKHNSLTRLIEIVESTEGSKQ